MESLGGYIISWLCFSLMITFLGKSRPLKRNIMGVDRSKCIVYQYWSLNYGKIIYSSAS